MANCCLAFDNFNRQLYGVSNGVDDDWNDSDDSLDRLVWMRQQQRPPDTIHCWNDDDVDRAMHAHLDDWSELCLAVAPVNLANFRTVASMTYMSMCCGYRCMVIELLLPPMVNECVRPSNYCAPILLRAACVISLNDYHCPNRDDLMMAVFGCHRLFHSTNSYHLRHHFRMCVPVIFRPDFRVPAQIEIGNLEISLGILCLFVCVSITIECSWFCSTWITDTNLYFFFFSNNNFQWARKE